MKKKTKYYYTYKITCLCGSFKSLYYIGKRVSKNKPEADNYTGSGVKIKNYFKKYGRVEGETYNKEIICLYNSLEELNKGERQLIGDKYLTDNLCLNLKRGGEGGSAKGVHIGQIPWNKGKKMSKEMCEMFSIHQKGKKHSETTKQKMSKTREGHKNYMLKQTEEARKKISAAFKGRHWILDENNKRHWI